MTRQSTTHRTLRPVAATDHFGHADIPPPSDADWLPSPPAPAVEPTVEVVDAESRSEMWCG